MRKLIVASILLILIYSCSKQKEVTSPNSKDNSEQQKSKIDSLENLLSKKDLYENDDSEVTVIEGPNEDEAMKNLKKEIRKQQYGPGFNGITVLEEKIVGRISKDDKIIIQAIGHVMLDVRGYSKWKQEQKFQIEMFYKKFGTEWTLDQVSRNNILTRDINKLAK